MFFKRLTRSTTLLRPRLLFFGALEDAAAEPPGEEGPSLAAGGAQRGPLRRDTGFWAQGVFLADDARVVEVSCFLFRTKPLKRGNARRVERAGSLGSTWELTTIEDAVSRDVCSVGVVD